MAQELYFEDLQIYYAMGLIFAIEFTGVEIFGEKTGPMEGYEEVGIYGGVATTAFSARPI